MDAGLLVLGTVGVVGVVAIVSIVFGRPLFFRANQDGLELSTDEKAKSQSKTRPK